MRTKMSTRNFQQGKVYKIWFDPIMVEKRVLGSNEKETLLSMCSLMRITKVTARYATYDLADPHSIMREYTLGRDSDSWGADLLCEEVDESLWITAEILGGFHEEPD